jgi:protein TonB
MAAKIAAAGIPRLWSDREDDPPRTPLTTALAVAGALHLMLLLGVSFEMPDPPSERAATRPLEVIVLRHAAPTEKRPEKADAYAQVDREGGGPEEVAEPEIEPAPEPAAPPPAPEPTEQAEPLPPPVPVEALTPVPPQPLERSTLTATLPDLATEQPPPTPEPQPEAAPEPQPEAIPEAEAMPPEVTAAQIMASRSLEIAELTARINEKSNAYANRQRRKAISASTREYKYANYLEAWRRKVERIGNLNYPDEAKQHKLYGNLILHVAVRSDGSIERVRVLRSSGFDVLDEAAVRIVELAAPFSPFPPDIKEDTDILDITRTWQFLRSNRLGWDN